jgi:hypothetical protein
MLRAVSGGGSSTPGSQIRNASGVPSNSLGIDGDYYIDTDTGFMYQRVSGAYAVQMTLKGSPGDDGSSVQNVIIGAGAPDSSIGAVGQAYLDAASNLLYPTKGVSSVTPQGFWGVNCHIGYPTSYWPNMTPASYLALFAANGIQAMRTNCSSASKATTYLSQYKALVAGGCDVLICIDAGPNYGGTFASNQTTGNTIGAAIANVLKGSGIVKIECTNECDGPFPAGAGTKITGTNPRGFVADGASYDDFDPARFECWRGMLSGLLAGIRSVTSEFKLGYASGNAFPQTAFRMMREGRDTTGAVTKTPLQLDIHCPHFYDTESSNPLQYTAKSRIGTNQLVNSLAELRGLTGNATYDVPQTPPFEVYITEWGSRASDVNQGNFINSASMVYYNNRTTYGINGIYVYGLFADSDDSGTGPVFGVAANNFGMIQADGTTKKPSWNYYTANAKANTAIVPGGWARARYLPAQPYTNGTQVLNTLTTTNNVLRSITIPGGAMGPNTMLRISAVWSCPNNANTKTFRVGFGGVTWHQSSYTNSPATATVRMEIIVQNRNALNSQVGAVVSMIGPNFNSGPALTGAIDTTVDQVVTFSAQAGVATDQLALECCAIELIG